MAAPGETDWDLVEELTFQCLELRSRGAEGGGAAAVDALLSGQPSGVAAAVRRVLAGVSTWAEPMRAELPELKIPDRLGPYVLGARLGQGGMGAVYAATDESLGREVAVKVIRPDLLAFGGARERFRREVEAVAKLSHPGIVPVYQVGETDGVPWFAMELVRGASLADVLRRLADRDPAALCGEDLRVALPDTDASPDASAFAGDWERTCLRLARELADALAHAHGRSVLHRDVKPSNVVVSANGHARLCDFGLAHADDGAELTRSGALLGSLPYAPPEQVRGDAAEADVRADVYSLGVTLYELLTLRSPFLAEREALTRRNVEAGNAPPARQRHRGLSWEAQTVTAVAMDKDPARRYQSMAEFAADLQRVLDRRPIVARPPRTWLRLWRTAERHPVAATAVVAGVLAVVALVLVYTLGLRQERDRALRAQGEAELLRTVDRLRSYRAGVKAAQLALRLGQSDAARQQLDACPDELRAFEWRHLRAQVDESLTTVRVGDGFVRRVVSTSKGLFAAGVDGVVRRIALGDPLAVEAFAPRAPAGAMGLAASRDGGHVVSGHLDHTVRVWDGERCTLRAELGFDGLWDDRQLAARHKSCFAVAVAPDDATAYAVSAGGAVAAIDLASATRTGGFLLPLMRGGLFAIAVSPDGALLAVGHDHDVLLVTPSGAVQRTLRGHRGFVFSLQFSPDGRFLLSASQDRTARVWQVEDGALQNVLFGHDGEVHQAAFGGDGSVWTVSNDATLRNWDLVTGQELQRRLGHGTNVYGVAMLRHAERDLVATAGWDGTVRLWDARTGRARVRVGTAGRTLRQRVLLHDDGARCTVVDDGEGVRTFALPAGDPVEPLVAGQVDLLAVRGERRAVLRAGELLRSPDDVALTGSEQPLFVLAFLADGTLVGGEAGGAVLFWPPGQTVARRVAGHDGEVRGVLPLDGGCVTTGLDGRVLFWSGGVARELWRADAALDGAAVAPDGATLYVVGLGRIAALASADGAVRWQRELGGRMRDVAIASGGRRLLVAGSDRMLHVLDAGDGYELVALPAGNLLQSVAVTGDLAGDVAVTATVYSEIDVWYAR